MSRASYRDVAMTRSGVAVQILPHAEITVTYAGTDDPIVETIYEEATGIDTLPNPFTADENGNFVFFLDNESEVRLTVEHSTSGTIVLDYVQVRAAAGNFVTLTSDQEISNKEVELKDGSVSDPSLRFMNEPGDNTGWYKSADSEWAFTVDGTQKAVFDALGLKLLGIIRVNAGTVGAPTIANRSETGLNSGIYFPAEAEVAVAIDGSQMVLVDSVGLKVLNVLRLVDGSQTAPSVTFSNETGLNTGIYRVSEGVIGVTIDGTLRFTFSTGGLLSAGNNGITQLQMANVNAAPSAGYSSAYPDANGRWYTIINGGSLGPVGGSTAVTLTVAAVDANFAERLNADYRCDGTGDQTEINSAITALATRKGRIRLVGKTFTVNGSIAMNQTNVKLEGDGKNATTIFAANDAGSNTSIIAVSATGCQIANLTVDGNKANNAGRTSQRLINATASDILIENVTLQNCVSVGIVFGSTLGTLKNSSVLSCGDDNVAITSTDNLIDACYINGATVDGVDVSANNNRITNCKISNNAGSGVKCAGSSNTIAGNFITGNTIYGVNLATGATGINNLVAKNVITLNGQTGVLVAIDHNFIVSNFIASNSQTTDGSYLNISVSGNHCYIQGNVLRRGSQTNKPAYGIFVTGTNCYIGLNDTYDSGTTATIIDAGTNTRRAIKKSLDYVHAVDTTTTISSANTWTAHVANQTFRVDSDTSVIRISVRGVIYIGNMAQGSEVATRIVIDSAGTPTNVKIGGGMIQTASQYVNGLSGANEIDIEGLTIGNHTVRVEVRATATGTAKTLSSTNPETQPFAIQVAEHQR